MDKPFALFIFAGPVAAVDDGFYDFRLRYSTLAEAKEGATTNGWVWYHVVDLRTMKIVDKS